MQRTAKRFLSLALALLMVFGLVPVLGTEATAATGADIASVPQVRNVTTGTGSFTLTDSSRFFIVSDSDPTGTTLGTYVQTVNSEFAAKGLPSGSVLPIVYGKESSAADGDIIIKLDSSVGHAQGYNMTISEQNITITGNDELGVIYGLHTVLQSMVSGGTSLTCCTATDWPDVSERSLYLDCGRIYYTPDLIKSIIRTLSWNKMNVLYLDFSNNNATRFFLDEMNVTVDGTTYDITTAKPSDGYLTQSDMDGIIAEAKKYGVEIIPTFNSPGHIGGIKNATGITSAIQFETGTASDYDTSCGKVTLKIENETEFNFGVDLVTLYAQYFASKGCKSFNIAADEASLSGGTYDSTNSSFVNYVNALDNVITSLGMTTRMFNDGIKSADSGINTDITLLYWGPDGRATSYMNAGYNIVNFSYGAGLYYAYLVGKSAWWVWNQDASQIYSSWTPAVTNRDTDNSSTYTAAETVDITDSHFLGANFAVWSDYAFNSNITGDTMFAQNNYSMMQKILTVGERGWSTTCTKSYSSWQSGVTTAPGGVTISAARDTTSLPTASDITQVKQTLAYVDANGTKITSVTLYLGTDTKVSFTGLEDGQSITSTSADPSIVTAANSGDEITLSPVSKGKTTITTTVNDENDGEGYILNVTVYDPSQEIPIEDVPEYTAGTVTATEGEDEIVYVLDIDGVDAGEQYLIVAPSSGYALSHSGTSISSVTVTIDGSNAVISSSDAENALWTFSGSSSATIENGGYYLYRRSQSSLQCSTSNSTTWTVNSQGSGNYTVSYYRNGRTYYLRYSSGFGLSTSSANVRLYKKTTVVGEDVYTVDTTGITALLKYAKSLNADEYSNWESLGIDSLITAAENAKSAVTNPYSSETDAQSAQDAVNTAGENLRAALAQLMYKPSIAITVKCVDESGVALGEASYTFRALDNGEGGYDYNITAPEIAGYTYSSGRLAGTVTEATEITLVYKVKEFTVDNAMVIPITLIDYRADGLLFDHNINDEGYGYSLVHDKYGDTYTSASTMIDGTTLEFLQLGGHRTGVNPFGSSYSYTEDNAKSLWNSSTYPQLGCFARTGLVEQNLGTDGLPVYTTATVTYVAKKLADGVCNSLAYSDENNWNDIIYNTFLNSDSDRSVLDTDTTAFSSTFAVSKSYSDIANAYDLAWYLLQTLYVGDENTADVTDNVNSTGTYNLPIYGMDTDVYNKMYLIQATDDDGEIYYYLSTYESTTSHVVYDKENKAIYNVADGNDDEHHFFYPLQDSGYDKYLGDTTDMQYGGNDTNYPESANGSFTLRGESQFVYNAGQDLYFSFSGDDDVYLYINGVLALDIGGAHWPLVKTVNLDDVAEKCGLVDGEIATFTFFYMERNADASNFAIKTNLSLVERGIDVAKTAYSETDTLIPDGQVVDNGSTVNYGFSVTNKGNQTMNHIRIDDTDDNGGTVSIGYGVESPAIADTNDTVVMGSANCEIYITTSSGTEVEDSRQTFDTLEALSAAVADIVLSPGETLKVRFLTAKLNVPETTIIDYNNTIKVSAVTGGKTLTDSDTHLIHSYNAADTAKDFVVDFGIPMKATSLFAETARDYIVDEKVTVNSSSSLRYGTVEVSGTGFDTAITYTMNKRIEGVERIVLDVTYNFSGKEIVLQKVIRIIPASTVYYEEDYVTFEGTGDTEWSAVGTKIENAVQEDDIAGDVSANVYGYDSAYTSCSQYSLGSAMKYTASGSDYGTATFTFAGTGFDIIGLTSSKTGTIVVSVTNDSGYKKNYIVDTYYGYTYNDGEWTVDKDSSDTLYQVPVMKVEGLDYGTYTAKVTVAYGSMFDHTGAASYDFYFDAVRIYDPVGAVSSPTTAEQKYVSGIYKEDGEGWAVYSELRNMVISAETFNAGTTTDVSGLVFIDGKPNGTAEIADYTDYGPNNELYLKPGQAVAFNLVETGNNVADVMIGMKTTSGGASYAIYNAGGTAESKTIATATDMYYSIKDLKGGVIVIQNTGESGVISVTNVKTTFTEEPEAAPAVLTMNYASAMAAVASVEMVNSPAPTFEPSKFDVSLSRKSAKVGQKVKVTVTTSSDVEAVTVNGESVTSVRTNRWTGTKTWSIYVSADAAGQFDISVVAYDASGAESAPATASLTVTESKSIFDWFKKLF